MLLGDDYPGVGLVVLKQHIVARLVLLYERIFEVECIAFGGYDDIFHVGYCTYKKVGAHRVMSAVEVGRHPSFKVLRLTHIDYSPGCIVV